MGVTLPAAADGAAEIEVWDVNWDCLVLFVDLSTQWRLAVGFGGMAWLGLDYAAADLPMRLRGWEREKAAAVFSDLLVMEAEALKALADMREDP